MVSYADIKQVLRNQVSLRSLSDVSMCCALGGNVMAAALKPAWGFAPDPTEGDSPSDSLLRFAAVLTFFIF